jgi:hypothetical protein
LQLICTVTPASSNSEETHNTLKFAHRAKHIEIQVSQNKVILHICLLYFFAKEAELAQWSSVWMYTQTTQVQVLAEANLGAYFLLNKMPPSSSSVGLFFYIYIFPQLITLQYKY